MDAIYCPVLIGWPCLEPALWIAGAQAAGSIIAILAAAWIPARIAKRQLQQSTDRTKRQAESLAFALEPALVSLSHRLSHAERQWRENAVRFLQESDSAVVIPESLTDRLLDLHILGAAARPIHEAIVGTNELNWAANQQYMHWRYGGQYEDEGGVRDLPEPSPGVEARLFHAKRLTQSAIAKLREVHGV